MRQINKIGLHRSLLVGIVFSARRDRFSDMSMVLDWGRPFHELSARSTRKLRNYVFTVTFFVVHLQTRKHMVDAASLVIFVEILRP